MRRAVIFGVTGQDGFYMRELLTRQGIEVCGVARSSGDILGDVADFSVVERVVVEIMPDYVFHFAAQSSTQHSFLFDNDDAIGRGTLNILEVCRLHCLGARVFLSGSAMQFTNDGNAISESTPFEAQSPYAVSRIQSIYAGRYFRGKFGMKVYAGYFFNHDSPLRDERHVNQKVVRAVQRIGAGSTEKLFLGDVRVVKEFNFAGDSVSAVWQLVNQEGVFECVIGSGESYSILDWVVSCFNHIGKDWREHVVIDSNYAAEYGRLISNPSLIKSLGWRPQVNFNALVKLMMNN